MITVYADDNSSARLLMKKILTDIDPVGIHLPAENGSQVMDLMTVHNVDVLFLDIEMPGISGIETAHYLQTAYPKLNVVFVTGHPEYALDALKVHCSGFIEKPFDEDDIRDALNHLRFPLEKSAESPLRVRCDGSFTVFLNGKDFGFRRGRTMELFAYLVYKNGAMCLNGELLGILWEGDTEKAGFLRQLVKDMRDSFEAAGIKDIVRKRHGALGLNTEAYTLDGDLSLLPDEFGWH